MLIILSGLLACNVAEQTGEVGRETASVEAPPASYFRFPSQGTSVEEGQPLNFTIQRGGWPQIEQEEKLFVRIEGSADAFDYSFITQGGNVLPVYSGLFEVTFPQGIRNISLQIHLIDDSLYEETERIFLTLVPELTLDTYEVQSHSGFNIEIRNNDPAPVPTFQLPASTVLEGMTRTINLELSNPSYRETRSLVKIIGGGANSFDHNYVDQYVTFAAGATTASVNVMAINDAYTELDEELVLQVYPALGQDYPTSDNQHVLTIQEAGATPSFEFSVASGSLSESAVSQTLTVNFTGSFEGDLIVPIVASGSAKLGIDYKLSQEYIYLPNGDSSATVDIIPLNDDVYEGNETIVLTLEDQSFAIAGTNSSATWTLTDNEAPPTLDIPLSSYQTEEGKLIYLPITLTSPASDSIDVIFTVQGSSSATDVDDYVMAYSGSFTIYAGARHFHFPIRIKEDALFEGVETINITLDSANFQSLPAAVAIANNATSVLIKETANQPTINFQSAQLNVSEDDGSFDVTVELDRVSEVPLDFAIRTGGEAQVPGDYTAPSFSHTIPAGNLSHTFTVAMTDDAIDEPRQSVIFYLLQPGAMTLGPTKELIVQINDDDAPSVVSLAQDGPAQEGNSITFTATLDKVSEHNITVPVTLSGSAEEGLDYTLSSGQFYFPAGTTTSQIAVYTIEDNMYDNGAETVEFNIADGLNHTVAAPILSASITQAALYAAPPQVYWAPIATTLQAIEGQNFNATIELEYPTYQDVVVTILVDDSSFCGIGCAEIVPPLLSSENYDTNLHSRLDGLGQFNVVVPQGQSSAQVTFEIQQDDAPELVEEFALGLITTDDAAAATVDGADADLTIQIND